jgi:hypothetical protein
LNQKPKPLGIPKIDSAKPNQALKTAKGTHYADVLSKHYERRLKSLDEIIVPANQQPEPETPEAAIDKSELAIAAPKRIRDEGHLRFVASQACLVCGRTPAQAHHLRFAQLRSMGSKVSDEWTVPLCFLHHRALHDIGFEEAWWSEKGIDAKQEASKLWGESHEPNVENIHLVGP